LHEAHAEDEPAIPFNFVFGRLRSLSPPAFVPVESAAARERKQEKARLRQQQLERRVSPEPLEVCNVIFCVLIIYYTEIVTSITWFMFIFVDSTIIICTFSLKMY
jgi:hypothetical protein